ncbi:MAG: RND transporter, partial [Gemmatimonas sp.]
MTRLLTQPLTPESAVRISLIAHPALRATYAELGLARADVVQAALLANPVISFDRFTTGRFQEFGIAQSFIDLLSQPMRRRVAEAEMESARLRIANVVFQHVTDVRSSLVEAVAAAQVRDVSERAQAAAAASAVAATAIHAAGNLQELDLVSERAAAAEFQAVAIHARGESASTREQLARALGVSTTGAALILQD